MSLLDEKAIQTLTRVSDPPELEFADRAIGYIQDSSNGNYQNDIVFDFVQQSITQHWAMFDRAYLELPLSITPTASTFSAQPVVAFKSSILSLINKVIVQTSGLAPRDLLNHSTDLHFVNALRLLIENDHDWAYCSQQELMAAKDEFRDDVPVPTNTLSTSDFKNPKTLDVERKYDDGKIDEHKIVYAYNKGFCKRRTYLLTSALKKDGTWDYGTTGINTIIRIPIRMIHPFFREVLCAFPIINVPLKITFGLNIGNLTSFRPLCLGTTLAGSVETGTAAVANIVGGPTRIVYDIIKFSEQQNVQMTQRLAEGFKKTIRYPTYQVERFENISSSTELRHSVVSNFTALKRIWMLRLPQGEVQGAAWPDPVLTGNMGAENINVRINTQNYWLTPIQNQAQAWQMLKAQFPPQGPDYENVGQLSYQDFLVSHRIYCLDVSRQNDRNRLDPSAPLTINVEFTPTSGSASDYVYICEREEELEIDMSRGGTYFARRFA